MNCTSIASFELFFLKTDVANMQLVTNLILMQSLVAVSHTISGNLSVTKHLQTLSCTLLLQLHQFHLYELNRPNHKMTLLFVAEISILCCWVTPAACDN